MRNSFSTRQFRSLIALALLTAATGAASADDRFSLAVGQHGDLLVFGPHGEKAADLPVPSISQAVTVSGSTSFQVSYGRDVNDRLTAILAPNATQPEDLHFNVLGKSIDADKQAVVTLTFSRSLNSVSVDPGYVGVVQVNSSKIRHHELADDSYAPAPAPTYQPVSTAPETSYVPAPETQTASDPAPRDSMPDPSSHQAEVANSSAVDSDDDSSNSVAKDAIAAHGPLYWAEPVTDPNGYAPHVASDQMKLVKVQGSISVQTPSGDVREGSDGMIVPSGSTLSTADGSSAALFIGGVNSVRLLPGTDITVTHRFDGSVRHTIVNLQRGTIFSRVGRRAGETEKFEVRSPQGTSVATGTETADAIVGINRFSFTHKGSTNFYDSSGQFLGAIHGNGGGGAGMASFPPASKSDEFRVLIQSLLAVQNFNTNTNTIAYRVHHHLATEAEIAYYTAAIYGALIQEGYPADIATYIAAQVGAAETVAIRGLSPFFTEPMSRH